MTEVISMLPAYTPSLPAPSYSRRPQSNESSLDYTPQTRQPIQIPDDTFTKKAKRAILVLHNQYSDVAVPVYGPHLSVVSGELIISSPERVNSVQLHLHGTIDIKIPGAERVITTLDKTEILYKRQNTIERCPDRIPLATLISTTYTDPARRHAAILPPTFETPKAALLRAHVKSEYAMTVTIHTVQKFTFSANTTSIHVPFIYEIRDRPRHSFASTSPLESLKARPEEWVIATCTIGVRRQFISSSSSSSSSSSFSLTKALTPIQCQLVIPSTHVFALSDRIPFHLELYSEHPSESLGGFFGPGVVPLGGDEEPVQLSLVRQVHVHLKTHSDEVKEGTRHFILGKAVMRRVPPKLDDQGRGGKTLDWEGEISVDDKFRDARCCSGFKNDVVTVSDFLVLNLTPWCPRTSPFETCKRMFPIRLVTDSWSDAQP